MYTRNNGDFDHVQDEPQLKSNVGIQMKYAQFENRREKKR